MGKKKSVEMSKESKLKQKKAEEAALRKNKVSYFHSNLSPTIFLILYNHDNVNKQYVYFFYILGIPTNEERNGPKSKKQS